MSIESHQLILSTSPYIKPPVDTPGIMRHVIYALTPACLAAVYYFGIAAILVIAAAIAGAFLTEWLSQREVPSEVKSIRDWSAVVTGLLLALTLPPGIPLWMAFFGGVVAIALGKLVFGGLGQNIFNPSLVGRAFLQASFPVALTTWSPLRSLSSFGQLPEHTFTFPFLKGTVDAVTAATPLAQMKFEHKAPALLDLLLGNTAGSLGETSAVLLLLGGLYLIVRQFMNWRIPLAIFASVFVFGGIFHLVDAAKYPAPWLHLFSGGLVLGAVFMATDPVTSPVTQLGCYLFGAGIGLLVVMIRLFGGLPEGVMYAILLMNGVTPLLNRTTYARIYGGKRPSLAARE
ncbi:MAG: RnfABCDGE type electron transport complex subunit D [Myxococcales bacterium]|nr:RnfABCDGE type electron transport complex subunit D [Myxococcales bacterium]